MYSININSNTFTYPIFEGANINAEISITNTGSRNWTSSVVLDVINSNISFKHLKSEIFLEPHSSQKIELKDFRIGEPGVYLVRASFEPNDPTTSESVMLNDDLTQFSTMEYTSTFYVWSIQTFGVILSVAIGAATPTGLYYANRKHDNKKELDKLPQLSIIYEPKNNPGYYIREFDMPEEILTKDLTHKRRYLLAAVRNVGKLTAIDCKATVKLVGRDNGCSALSTEPKILVWHESGSIVQDIYPHGGEELVRISFSDTRIGFSESKGTKCKNQEGDARLYAYVCTPGEESYNEDGMCLGNFELQLVVRSRQGPMASQNFIIKVSKKWNELDMTLS